jgi:hypothetical protein
MQSEDQTQRDLWDDLADLGQSEPRATENQGVRVRDFSLLRWMGLGLMFAGSSMLFSHLWWAGLIVGLAGFAVVETDSVRITRRGDRT